MWSCVGKLVEQGESLPGWCVVAERIQVVRQGRRVAGNVEYGSEIPAAISSVCASNPSPARGGSTNTLLQIIIAR